MNLFLTRNKYPLLLSLIFVISEWIVNPLGEFPLNDDWSYSKSVLILLKEGDIYIGHWCAMSLASHVLWGALFTKAFGFSFFVLRFSTLLSSLIGILTLYRLIFQIAKNAGTAFIGALVVLFNPIYFNLSNTFMTDVNFNTWLILAFYFAYRFFETRKPVFFFLVFFMSLALVFCRQFGIIVPFGFIIACLFCGEKRWIYTALAVAGFVVVYVLFHWYENYLASILPPQAAYKYSGKVSDDPEFFFKFFYFISLRYKVFLIQVLMYTAPFTVAFLPRLLKAVKWKLALPVILVNGLLSFFGLGDTNVLNGNIFTNMALGPDTFCETLDNHYNIMGSHTYSSLFQQIIYSLQLLLVTLSGTVISLHLFAGPRKSYRALRPDPFVVFLVLFILTYLVTLFISNSFFDRYCLPFITVAVILLAFSPLANAAKAIVSVPLLALFIYVSVAGTRDYFTVNRLKLEAVNFVREKEKVSIGAINVGFEMNNWNDGAYMWWVDYFNPGAFEFLIQYKPEPGFSLYKTYEFQRCFPYKTDRINIFKKRQSAGQP